MARDKNAQLRNLIAGYGDSMRLSDIKALIAVLFVAIMMLTVLQPRTLSLVSERAGHPDAVYDHLSERFIRGLPAPGGNASQSGATPIRTISTSSPTLRPNLRGSPRYARVCRASSGGRT
jgi:hypothetical protein